MYSHGMQRRRIKLKDNVLYDYCRKTGISRDELARRVHVSNVTAYRIDDGRVDPSPHFIAGLIQETGMPFEDLFVIVTDEREQVPA